MLPDPNGTFVTGFAAAKTGDSGLEDSINSTTAAGTPDNVLEAIPAGKQESPEDVNNNGLLDSFGEANLGDGFGANACRRQPVRSARELSCYRPRELGFRRATRSEIGGRFTWKSANPPAITAEDSPLVQKIPSTFRETTTPAPPTPCGPIPPAESSLPMRLQASLRIQSRCSPTTGPTWQHDSPDGRTRAGPQHYLLSCRCSRRKEHQLPVPVWSAWQVTRLGTDGGVHNFLRFLEDWGGATLNYKGSLVNLYYSAYATGTYKCCVPVYQPPTRNYIFDPLFSQPQNLPPGTPHVPRHGQLELSAKLHSSQPTRRDVEPGSCPEPEIRVGSFCLGTSNCKMDSTKFNSQGFTLIASLLLLCLLSGIAIGLLMMVNTEGRAGGDDLQNTMAYRSAEAPSRR